MEVKRIANNSKKSKANNTQSKQSTNLSEAWTPFAQRLAQVLEKLEEDSFLVISKKQNTSEFIQVVAQGFFGLRIETTSDYFRDDDNQLTKEQISCLLNIGWSAPSGTQEYATPEFIPDGSPNYFADAAPPLNYRALADFIVKTFIEALHTPHPGFLQYEAFDSQGNTISLPDLGLQHANAVSQKDALPKLLIAALSEVTGITEWEFDADGNLGGITFGSATSHIQLLDDQQYIRIYSILLENAKESLQLLARVNELNLENGYMHIVVKNGVVIALSDLQVVPFVNNHLVNSLGNFCQNVDGIFDIINAEFASGASFVEQPSQQITH